MIKKMELKGKYKTKDTVKNSHHIDSSHELLVWEKWIRIRKEETSRLGKLTMRQPADLAMNLLEKVREDKEWKIVLEHAQIDKKPSLRGGIWEQPARLKQPCYCKPVYEAQRKAAEKGFSGVIEHIGVPDLIQETEKGLTGQRERNPCLQLNADYIKYRKQREGDLDKKIKKLDPFRPDITKLLVRGAKPKPCPKKLPPLPTITLTQEGTCMPEITTVYAVRINNTIIYKDIPEHNFVCLDEMRKESWHESCTCWTYYFNVPINRAGRGKLYLENLGTVTLRYCWKKLKKSIPFIPEDIYEQVFFFNKNEDVISPGQSKVLFFTFLSDQPGIFSEFWELNFCNICFFDTLADKLLVNLYADSTEDVGNVLKKVNILKYRIERKAKYNIVRAIINDVVNKALAIEPPMYSYNAMFLEAEMFLLKNPVCYYHQTEVEKMKELYIEMEPGKIWDLSIASWREKMMEKNYEDRIKYYDLLKKSQNELLKPWLEGESVLRQKYRAMKWLLGNMADKFSEIYERLLDNDEFRKKDTRGSRVSTSSNDMNPYVYCKRNLFYIHAYEILATTIETCAGVLSSIDLNRWIEFDFCRI